MKNHTKKMIAPIIISIFLVIYFICYASLVIFINLPFLLKIIGSILSILFLGVSVFVLFERIKEIRSGEEDDISKY